MKDCLSSLFERGTVFLYTLHCVCHSMMEVLAEVSLHFDVFPLKTAVYIKISVTTNETLHGRSSAAARH